LLRRATVVRRPRDVAAAAEHGGVKLL